MRNINETFNAATVNAAKLNTFSPERKEALKELSTNPEIQNAIEHYVVRFTEFYGMPEFEKLKIYKKELSETLRKTVIPGVKNGVEHFKEEKNSEGLEKAFLTGMYERLFVYLKMYIKHEMLYGSKYSILSSSKIIYPKASAGYQQLLILAHKGPKAIKDRICNHSVEEVREAVNAAHKENYIYTTAVKNKPSSLKVISYATAEALIRVYSNGEEPFYENEEHRTFSGKVHVPNSEMYKKKAVSSAEYIVNVKDLDYNDFVVIIEKSFTGKTLDRVKNWFDAIYFTNDEFCNQKYIPSKKDRMSIINTLMQNGIIKKKATA